MNTYFSRRHSLQSSPVSYFPEISGKSIPHHQMRNTWQSDVTCEGIWLLVLFQDLVDQEWCRRTRG